MKFNQCQAQEYTLTWVHHQGSDYPVLCVHCTKLGHSTAGVRDSGVSKAHAAGLGSMVPGNGNPCASTPESTRSRLGTRPTQ